MIASFLITLREGIEAALIVAIVLSYLKKVGASALLRPVYIGVLAGVLASIAAGSLFLLLSVEFEGTGEQIFEGATMSIAAIVLTTMIFWMRDNSRAYSEGLKNKVQAALTSKETLGLTALVFVSILREGIETVLFLGSASFTTTGVQTVIGGTAGLVVAIAAGLAIIKYSVKMDLRAFFNVTGVFLVLFAAGLVARGLGEFQEAGIVPSVIDHIWDTSGVISDGSDLGEALGALFGYTAAPSLVQIFGYAGYWLFIALWTYRQATMSVLRRAFAVVRPSA
jgi:high-affinity iron transporter